MPDSHFAEPVSEDVIQRRTMVDCQIRTVDVTDHAVITQFLAVPRDKFLPPELAPFAYSDMALKLPPMGSLAAGRELLPPAVLARLIQAAAVNPTDKVLDIASATGYSSAIFAGLAQEVVALEAEPARADAVKTNLVSVGNATVRVLTGALADGAPSEAPFDVIFVNGAVECHLDTLFQQLRSGGRLLCIARKTAGPDRGASHAVRFESQFGRVSSSLLFDAEALVLTEFRKEAEFVF
jgi:protein-L-isoaspartate(D-aspartate) O-methyltransferase